MFKDIVAAHGHLNAFGMDLSKSPLSSHSGIGAAAPFWIVLLIMAGTSYLQTAQMMSRNPSAAQNNPQMRIMKYVPLLFAVLCMRFPAGVIVYYAMSNICRIVQQDAMYRFDPRVKTLVAQEVIEVEERTHEIDEAERQRRSRPGYTPPRGARQPSDTPAKQGSDGQGGRVRFRDIWAQAAEQQKGRQAKGAPTDRTGSGSGGQRDGAAKSKEIVVPTRQAGTSGGSRNGSAGSRNGSGGSSNGAQPKSPSANRPPASKNRSRNKKRRGR
jgi:hypothetical protein